MSVEQSPRRNEKSLKPNLVVRGEPDGGRASAIAIVGLLCAAKNAAKVSFSNDYCVTHIQKCEELLRVKYNIGSGLVPKETYDETYCAFIVLIRMLSYIHMELSENFNDASNSDIIGQCIRHLVSSQNISPNDLYPSKVT